MIGPAAGLLAEFHPPTTKDFVWPSGELFGVIPFQFIYFLVFLCCLTVLAFFYFAFRKPKLVPGKLQLIAELGFNFVKENIVVGMIGPEGMVFFALLSTFFFYIFAGNIWEVLPGVNFSMNSRIAFPIVLAIIAWITFLVVGFKKHGAWGYMKHIMFPPGVPMALKPLIAFIELLQVFLIRPLTLSVRLFANMVAGHFLLAVFFLATFAFFTAGNLLLAGLGVFSGALAVALVGFEIFVSGLQAFIFAVLTASYIQGAMAEEH